MRTAEGGQCNVSLPGIEARDLFFELTQRYGETLLIRVGNRAAVCSYQRFSALENRPGSNICNNRAFAPGLLPPDLIRGRNDAAEG